MGFGTLFIGYFLLLNLTYYTLTDVIAAAVMLLGLYKLSPVNKYFRFCAISCAVFLAFSLGEFGIGIYEMFMKPISSPALISAMSIIRSVIICALTLFMLKGVELVAKEVEVENLPKKALRAFVATAIIYAMWIILEVPVIDSYALAVISVMTILATIVLLIINLSVIYSCYMRICMPSDLAPSKQKPSRFGFVNEYRARKEEREKEAAKQRARLLNETKERQKGKKK